MYQTQPNTLLNAGFFCVRIELATKSGGSCKEDTRCNSQVKRYICLKDFEEKRREEIKAGFSGEIDSWGLREINLTEKEKESTIG